jgi:hypothetical protein
VLYQVHSFLLAILDFHTYLDQIFARSHTVSYPPGLIDTRLSSVLTAVDGLRLPNMTSVMRGFTSIHKSIIKLYCGPDRPVTATPKSRRHILTSKSNDGNPHRSTSKGSLCTSVPRS